MSIRALSPRPVVATSAAPLHAARRPAPRPSPDSFAPGVSIATLETRLRRAEDLMAFRLGGLRATVFTAAPQHLSDAALASGERELERAGRGLKRSNEQLLAAGLRRERLEAQVVQRPGDARLIHELDAAREREVALHREVRSDAREVQRLLSSVDVDTLARIEQPLRGFAVPEAQSVKQVRAEVTALRAQLAARR